MYSPRPSAPNLAASLLTDAMKMATELSVVVGHVATRQNSQRSFDPAVAAAVLCDAFFDMTYPETPKDDPLRRESRELGVLFFTGIGCADMLIDGQGDSSLSPREFLEKLIYAFQKDPHYVPQVGWEQASFEIAKKIRPLLAELPDRGASLIEKISVLKEQTLEQQVCTDPSRLMELAAETGGGCLDLLAIVIESVKGEKCPRTRAAAKHFGAYGQVRDNLCDMYNDYASGTRTYATQMLSTDATRHGRKKIKDESRAKMTQEWAAVNEVLRDAPRELAIMKALKGLLDLKYSLQLCTETVRRIPQVVRRQEPRHIEF